MQRAYMRTPAHRRFAARWLASGVPHSCRVRALPRVAASVMSSAPGRIIQAVAFCEGVASRCVCVGPVVPPPSLLPAIAAGAEACFAPPTAGGDPFLGLLFHYSDCKVFGYLPAAGRTACVLVTKDVLLREDAVRSLLNSLATAVTAAHANPLALGSSSLSSSPAFNATVARVCEAAEPTLVYTGAPFF